MGNCGTFTFENGVCAQTPVVPHAMKSETIWKIYLFDILLWYINKTS